MPLDQTQKQVLSKVPLFAGLSKSEMEFLSGRIVPRHYAAGQIVFNESDPCAGPFVVSSGNVRIFKTSANGREQVLSVDGPGSSVAELPVFDGGNYPASVAAVEGDRNKIAPARREHSAGPARFVFDSACEPARQKDY